MFGLELLMAGMIATPVTDVQYSRISCVPRKAPQVSVVPSKSRVTYDYSKSKDDLANFDIDTISPYGPEHQTHVGGLMSGSIQVSHSIGFMHETFSRGDAGCVHISSIDVKIHIDPTIYIASEYKKGTCEHRHIMEHEKKHVREDQLIVNKYAAKIGKALAKTLDNQGPVFGPYKQSELEQAQKNLQDTLTAALEGYNETMNNERRERQQAIDSREEYDNISNACR